MDNAIYNHSCDKINLTSSYSMSDSNFRASTFFRGIYILNSEHADRNSNGMFKWRNYWMEHALQRTGTRHVIMQ